MPWEATNKAHPAPCLEAAGTCSQRTTRNCTHTQWELSRVVVDCTFRKQKLSLSLTLVLYSGSESSLLSTRCACLFCVLCLYVCMITCTPGVIILSILQTASPADDKDCLTCRRMQWFTWLPRGNWWGSTQTRCLIWELTLCMKCDTNLGWLLTRFDPISVLSLSLLSLSLSLLSLSLSLLSVVVFTMLSSLFCL